MTHYTRIEQTPEEENGTKIVMEVEGIPLSSRGKSKRILYVECASHRRRNDPECNFRGRIINYHSPGEKGMIEIIKEHTSKCKYLPGNEDKDF